jgi:melibiose permease
MLVPLIGYAAIALSLRFVPNAFIPFAISGFVANIGYGFMSVMQGVMLADAVDYGEYNTGKRNEGIVFSTLTFLSKVAKAFGELFSIVILGITKFGGQDSMEVTPAALAGFKFQLYMLPPILLVLAFLLYHFKFKLNPERVAEIQEELARRKDVQAAQLSQE